MANRDKVAKEVRDAGKTLAVIVSLDTKDFYLIHVRNVDLDGDIRIYRRKGWDWIKEQARFLGEFFNCNVYYEWEKDREEAETSAVTLRAKDSKARLARPFDLGFGSGHKRRELPTNHPIVVHRYSEDMGKYVVTAEENNNELVTFYVAPDDLLDEQETT